MHIDLDIAQTVGVAAVFLVIGKLVKNQIPILSRYFIPSPIIGGVLFSLFTLFGYLSGYFTIGLDDYMRDFLLMAFFTTIGFSASFELLKKGGIGVVLLLLAAVLLMVLQNITGVGLAVLLGESPLLGMAAGSISLTGGHGTSAAFAPLLEEYGAVGALPAAMAAATWGLVAGCIIGGPLGSRLMRKHNIKKPDFTAIQEEIKLEEENDVDHKPQLEIDGKLFDISMYSVILLAVCIGIGSIIVLLLKKVGITIPSYLGAMLVAAVARNIIDWRSFRFPRAEMETIGSVSLAFFLVMALMSMKLWELASVAGPLLIIMMVQTALVFLFAYYVTFRLMGKDYDAVVIATGHCGFGLGATPNAMANIQSFTDANGPSPKAFFVIPLVGSLFIDFFNAVTITSFISFLK